MIVLWCTGGFKGALNWAPLMPRDASLSDRLATSLIGDVFPDASYFIPGCRNDRLVWQCVMSVQGAASTHACERNFSRWKKLVWTCIGRRRYPLVIIFRHVYCFDWLFGILVKVFIEMCQFWGIYSNNYCKSSFLLQKNSQYESTIWTGCNVPDKVKQKNLLCTYIMNLNLASWWSWIYWTKVFLFHNTKVLWIKIAIN